MLYAYEALAKDQETGRWKKQRDRLVTTDDPVQELRDMQLKPIRVRKMLIPWPRWPWQRIQAGDLAQWYDQMAMLVHLESARAIEICSIRSEGPMKRLLSNVSQRLRRKGTTLDKALSAHPEIPSEHVALLVSVRNQRPEIRRDTWTTLSETVQSDEKMDKKVSNVRWNIIMIFGAMLFMLYMLGAMDPGIEDITKQLAGHPVAEGAATTFVRAIIAWLVSPAGIMTGIFAVGVYGGLALLVRLHDEVGTRWELLLWSMPYFGKIFRAIETSKVARGFGALYRTNDPATAMDRLSGISRRRIIAGVIGQVAARLRGRKNEGRTDLETAFTHRLLDPMLAAYLVGARGGSEVVSNACREVGAALSRDAYNRLQRWLDEFEPLVIFAALTLGSMAASVVMDPLFSLLNAATHAYTATYYIPTHTGG